MSELRGAFQQRVRPWMLTCFGEAIAADKLERDDRFLEEVLESLQAGGYPPERVTALRDYVYDRPAGEPDQEIGGVMVTLAARCLAYGLDMHEAGERELARISRPEIIEKIRTKQAAKPTGSALPIAVPAAHPVEAEALDGGWLIEENASGFIHWIALSSDEWPRAKITTRRARMNADFDIEETRYLTPVIRVKDANAALRFARKEDAEAFIRLFDRFLLHPVATEHQWATLRARSGMLSAEKEVGK